MSRRQTSSTDLKHLDSSANASPSKPSRFTSHFKPSIDKVKLRFRRMITGNDKKRIRDLIREKEKEPSYIRFFDKVGFTLGVLNITVCQFFLLNYPRYYWLWYSLVIPCILFVRAYHYSSLGWQYFMFDFCYFAISLTFLDIYVFETPLLAYILSFITSGYISPSNIDSLMDYSYDASSSLSSTFFKIMFIFTNGPLPVAIPVWRNSIVFHDYDKITSVYIHILPSMLYYCARWYGHECIHRFSLSFTIPFNTSSDKLIQICLSKHEKFIVPKLYISDYLYAALIYLFWQTCYFLKTEVIDKDKLDKNPELLTSLRWLSTDTKNPMARAVLKILKYMGIFQPNEDYDSRTAKTKIVFMGSQFVYTFVTFLITPILYRSHIAHLGYIILIFISSVYNGASFYIDIFSKRYQRKMENLIKLVGDSS